MMKAESGMRGRRLRDKLASASGVHPDWQPQLHDEEGDVIIIIIIIIIGEHRYILPYYYCASTSQATAGPAICCPKS